MPNQVWVSPSEGKWKVHISGDEEHAHYYRNKEDAIQEARQIATLHDVELLVQSEDGRIEEKSSDQIWVSPENGRWKVHYPGENKRTQYFDNRRDALNHAHAKARQLGREVVLQDMYGRIEKKDYSIKS